MTLQKSDNSTEDSSSDTISLSLNAVALSGTYVQGTLTSCGDVSASSGVATFSGCAVSSAGEYTLTATDTTTNTVAQITSAPFYISGAAQLVFAQSPVSSTANTVWSASHQPQVVVEDAQGNALDKSGVKIGVAIQNGTGTGGAILGCDTSDSPHPNVATIGASPLGEADFTNCKIDKTGSGYRLYAVDPTDHLISAPTAAFNISAGSATHIVFSIQPGGSTGGVNLSPQPVVSVEDAGGNVVNDTSNNVALSIKSGTGATGAALTCSSTLTVTPVAGVAAYTGCKINKSSVNTYQLHATWGSFTADSNTFTINTGPAHDITFSQDPSGGAPGVAFTDQPEVALTDAGGNPVNGTVALSITSNTGTTGASLTCSSTSLGTSGGTASFDSCAIDRSGTDYELHAVSGSLSTDSGTFSIGGGSASALSFTTSPGATGNTGGSAFATQPVVHVTDEGGQAANASVTLSIDDGSGSPGATLTCSGGLTHASSGGDANFSGCAIDKAGDGYRLDATISDVHGTVIATATSDPFSVGVGDPAQLAFTAEPGASTGGQVWATQPVVTVEDAGGNPVSDATGHITLSRTSGTGSGSLTCQDPSVALQVGAAYFSGCSIDTTAAAYTLSATWDSHGSIPAAVSDPFAITPGHATSLVFTTQPAGATAGSAFVTQPTVTFGDAGGNATSDGAAAVTLAVATGSGPGSLSGCAGGALSGGSETFSGCSVNLAGADYALTATGGGLHTDSLAFSVKPPAPTISNPTLAIPTAETFGGNVYGVNPTDIVDDVNTATGSLTFASTDLRVAAIAKPLLVARTYNSADSTGGFFGPGWSSLFDVGVTIGANNAATVRGEDGQQTVWNWNSKTKTYSPAAGGRGAITCGGNIGNHCRVTRADGSMWDVNYTAPGGGQLQTYKGQDTQGLTFNWTPGHVAITVASTSATPYVINGTIVNGRITSLTTPAGRTVSYGYTNGLLTSVTDSAGRTWHYTYTGGLLTGQSDGDGTTRLSVSYLSSRVSAISAQGSSSHTDDTFSYNTATGVTTRGANVNVGGSLQRVNYTYTYIHNNLVAQSTPSGSTTRYAYDIFGNLTTILDPLGFFSRMAYDSGNNLVTQTDALGHVSSMTYDSQHRILSNTDANGNKATYTYTGPYLSSMKMPSGAITTMTYNNLGELVLVRGPLGQKAFSYDAFGNQINARLQTLAGAAVDGPGTSSTFDEAGDKLTSTDPDGRTTTSTYDGAGDVLTVALPGGQTTRYTYSGGADLASVQVGSQTTTYSWNEAHLTRTTDVGGNDTVETYDPSGNLLTQTAGGTTTSNSYNSDSELVATTDASGVTTRYTYDPAGDVVLTTSDAGDSMSTQYDAMHRQIRQVLDGAVTLTTYDADGNTASTTDPQGRRTSYTYSSTNHVLTATLAGKTTTYTYDLDGNETSVRDPEGHATTYTYDAGNRRTTQTFNGTSTTTFGLDNAGNVTTLTDPDGRVTTYTLDDQNRPTTTTYSWQGNSYSVTQVFNALGERTSMTDPGGTHTYTYDSSGDLTSASYGNNTFSYDYSHAGKIVETYPDGTVISYGLDDARNVMSVESGTSGQPGYVHAAYMRNAQRFTTATAFGNGVLETRQLDQAGHVLGQTLSTGGTNAATDTFTYDAAGDRVTQVDNVDGSVTSNRYSYDGAGRLLGFQTSTSTDPRSNPISWPPTSTTSTTTTPPTSGGPGITPTFAPSVPVSPASPLTDVPATYAYDGAGNQTSTNGTSNSYNAADELTTSGANGATYDSAGNLVSFRGTTYTYDAANHLVGVNNGTTQITYTYDGDGNRITKTAGGDVTDYLWEPASGTPQLDLEQTGGGSLIRRYFYGDGPVAMQTPSATYYYHLDPQGSVMELTDSSGQLAASYHYDGFGNVTTDQANAPANPILFQGGFLDSDTGLYDLGLRNYDPTLGRFTQRDPLDRPAGSVSVSPYVFVDDRTTVFTDPTGAFPTATDVFWSHNSVGANVGTLANYTVSAVKVLKGAIPQIKAFAADPEVYLTSKWTALKNAVSELGSTIKTKAGEAWDYIAGESKQAVSSAEEEIATNVGETATADAEAAGQVLEREAGTLGELGEAGGEVAADASVAVEGAGDAAKFGGIALSVIGIGLQTFITVEDCMHDTISKCVGDAVGTAVSIAFTIACTVATEGVGAVLCGIAGAAISVALTEVISRYGPQIAAGFVTAYHATAAALTTAADWVASTATQVGGLIVTGVNTAISAIKSGWDTTINTLVNAGYSAEQLAITLAHQFAEGIDTAVNALVGFGYHIADIATALFNGLHASLDRAVLALKNTFNYTVSVISSALENAYNATAHAMGVALQAARYAVDEVARGLKSAFSTVAAGLDAGVAAVLDGLNYTVNQIAGALQTVYHDADAAVATIFNGLQKGYEVVTLALQSVYHDIDTAMASALNTAGYVLDDIANALKRDYREAAAVAAAVIHTIDAVAADIAGALNDVFQSADHEAALILRNLSYDATVIAGALHTAYLDAEQAVTNALETVQFAVDSVAAALKHTFANLINDATDVATYLYNAGYALAQVGTAMKDEFAKAAAEAVKILDGLVNDLNAAATALATSFLLDAEGVANALKNALVYTVDQIAGVLENAFAQAAEDAANILKSIGVAIGDIIGALQDIFGMAENAIATVLNDIHETLADIASALESAFNQLAGAVANVLSAIGISTADIDAIGQDFENFGNAIVSGVESAWDTVSSWF